MKKSREYKHFFWRQPLLPNEEFFECKEVPAPPHPPSAITDVLVSEITQIISEEDLVLSLVVSWSGPMYPNGELEEIELVLRQCSGEWISHSGWKADVSLNCKQNIQYRSR